MTSDPLILGLLLLFLLAIGAFAGVLAGLLGVGGGIVLVPAFFYLFSVLGFGGEYVMQICLGTSLATIVVTSVRSVMSHNRKGAVDWGILKGWAIWIALGAIVGSLTVSSLSSVVLQAIFGVLGFVIGLYLGVGRQDWHLSDKMPEGIKRIILAPTVGFLSVLMGIGGGSFGVPLMSLHSIPIHRAVATAAGFGLAISVPSLPSFLFIDIPADARPPFTLGAVNIPAFLIVIAMTITTAPWGANLAHAMNPGLLKRVFGGFLIIVSLNMLRSAVF